MRKLYLGEKFNTYLKQNKGPMTWQDFIGKEDNSYVKEVAQDLRSMIEKKSTELQVELENDVYVN